MFAKHEINLVIVSRMVSSQTGLLVRHCDHLPGLCCILSLCQHHRSVQTALKTNSEDLLYLDYMTSTVVTTVDTMTAPLTEVFFPSVVVCNINQVRNKGNMQDSYISFVARCEDLSSMSLESLTMKNWWEKFMKITYRAAARNHILQLPSLNVKMAQHTPDYQSHTISWCQTICQSEFWPQTLLCKEETVVGTM